MHQNAFKNIAAWKGGNWLLPTQLELLVGLGNANMGTTRKQSDLRKPQFFGLPNEANRCVS